MFMYQTLQQMHEAKVLPNVKNFNKKDVITKLSGICENRFRAISAYPHAVGASTRFKAIEQIRYNLNQVKEVINLRHAAQDLLRLELQFHLIAPAETNKLSATYKKRVSEQMDILREYLGWRVQECH